MNWCYHDDSVDDAPINGGPVDSPEAGGPDLFEYTAFQHWEYQQVIYKVEDKQSWRDLGEGFYRASKLLVERVVARDLNEDIEGLAAIFLFRHYLELVLKRIVIHGRYLVTLEENAEPQEVKEVAKIHELQKLWEWVLSDAKPKIEPSHWAGYDTAFVEQCLAEFDAVDNKGFAFRYPGLGSEFCRYDFLALHHEMEHIYQVLEGIETYLIEAYGQNAEFDEYLESEYGADLEY